MSLVLKRYGIVFIKARVGYFWKCILNFVKTDPPHIKEIGYMKEENGHFID